jgi:hypothetical protein
MDFASAFNKMLFDTKYVVDTGTFNHFPPIGWRIMGSNETIDDVGSFTVIKGKRVARDTRVPESELNKPVLKQADDASWYINVFDDGDVGIKENYGKSVSLGMAGYLDETIGAEWRKANDDEAEKKKMKNALNSAEIPIGYLMPETNYSTEVQWLNHYGITFTKRKWEEEGIPLTEGQQKVGFVGVYEFN